jgi:predicted regulator of Ras-like GTPase activity (Roadblock/LC7/MglB family)
MQEGPLAVCLSRVIEEMWSGSLEVCDAAGQPLGQVVLSYGKIAWAACRGQSENLGVFLWRLGRITKDQLAHVQQIFREQKGEKKLGAILEESGILSRSVLRRCLLLHTRSALEALLAHGDAQTKMWLSAPRADERILFAPNEVLPAGFSSELVTEWTCGDSGSLRSWRRLNNAVVLEQFMELPGHQGSAIVSSDGDLVAANSTSSALNFSLLSVFVTATLEAAAGTARAAGMSALRFLVLECQAGTLVARWLDDARRELVLVLVDPDVDVAPTQRAIAENAPLIIEWLRGARAAPRATARTGLAPAATTTPPVAPDLASAIRAAVIEPLEPSSPEAIREWDPSEESPLH